MSTYKKNIIKMSFFGLIVFSNFLTVITVEAGWFGDTICCNSGSIIGNGDGNAGANLGGGGGGNNNNNSNNLTPIQQNAINNLTTSRPPGSTLIDVVTHNGKTYEIFSTIGGPNGQFGPHLSSVEVKPEGGDSNNNNSVPTPAPSQCNAVPNPNLMIQDIVFYEIVTGGATTRVSQNELKVNTKYQPVVQIRNVGCSATSDTRFLKNEMPFGSAGTFPVRLRVDYGNNTSYEIVNYINNVAAINAASTTEVTFPVITIPAAGLHKIEGVVDIKGSDDVGRGCTGAWGCIAERGNPTSNTRVEDFTAIAPSVNLQSYLVKPHNIFSGEVPTDLRAGDRNYSGQTRRLGLFWTGTLVNLTNCTGTAVTSLGAPTLDFNGRPDPTTVSSRNSRYVSRLGTSNYDYNITEPPRGTNHVYTINCSTSDGQTVSDTIVISNNGPASPASATLSGTDCIIASGADSCASELTWDIVSAAAPNIFNDTHNQQYSTATKQTNVRYSIERGDNDIQARDGGSVLEEVTVTATCAATAPWSASLGICFDPSAAASSTPLTITLTAQSKFVRMNESTRITWSMSTAIPTGFTCTLSGAGIADTPVTTATGSFVSAAIGNKSLYKISCVSATETISGDATVEVIPNIQEV